MDSFGHAECDDGLRYVVKRDAGWPVRASEWLCSRMSQYVGIATPQYAIIEMLNGDLLFGSQILAGVADRFVTEAFLLMPTVAAAPPAVGPAAPPVGGGNGAAQAIAPKNSAGPASNATAAGPTLSSLLSSIYAFDLAIGNEDRHLGNYLSVEVASTKRIYAFDYSRALFLTWPLHKVFPLQWSKFATGPSNTLVYGRILWQAHGFDLPSALQTVERLEQMDVAVVSAFVAEMPTDWLPEPHRSDFIQWWTDGRRSDRLDALRKGLTDGSLVV